MPFLAGGARGPKPTILTEDRGAWLFGGVAQLDVVSSLDWSAKDGGRGKADGLVVKTEQMTDPDLKGEKSRMKAYRYSR